MDARLLFFMAAMLKRMSAPGLASRMFFGRSTA
jgi:hypothetical protein